VVNVAVDGVEGRAVPLRLQQHGVRSTIYTFSSASSSVWLLKVSLSWQRWCDPLACSSTESFAGRAGAWFGRRFSSHCAAPAPTLVPARSAKCYAHCTSREAPRAGCSRAGPLAPRGGGRYCCGPPASRPSPRGGPRAA
jgi:hypothetical protein